MSRKLLLTLLTVGLLAVPAVAQEAGEYAPIEVYGGFVFNNSELSQGTFSTDETGLGFTGGLTYNFHPNVGVFGEFSMQTGEFPDVDVDFDQTQFLFGPRFFFPSGKIKPFAHVPFGFQRMKFPGAFSGTDFMWGFGGGVDINVNERFAIRAVQFDYLTAEHPIEGPIDSNNLRLTFGVVIKLGGNQAP